MRSLAHRALSCLAVTAAGLWLSASPGFAAFGVVNRDCLNIDCHGTAAPLPRLNIAGDFQTDDQNYLRGAAGTGLLSQHNVRYTCDNDLATDEVCINECRNCHGTGASHRYIRDQAPMYYPDAITAKGIVWGTRVPKSTNFSNYQDFCLSCHDGFDDDAVPAHLALRQLTGQIPANQRAPSDRTNPGAGQAMGGTRLPATAWLVPPQPPKSILWTAPAYTNAVPTSTTRYFAYYETNGHGFADSIEGAGRMNVTCLAGGAGPQGCHTPHGSSNRHLIDTFLFGTAKQTATDFAVGVCYVCHLENELKQKGLLPNNDFHAWSSERPQPVHANLVGSPGAGMSQWKTLDKTTNQYSMDIYAPFVDLNGAGVFPDKYRQTGILPFYASDAAPIEDRLFAPTVGAPANLTPDNTWVHCLTCHDPHGTAPTHDFHAEFTGAPNTGPENTEGMLRKFPVGWNYFDPLCGECHSTKLN